MWGQGGLTHCRLASPACCIAPSTHWAASARPRRYPPSRGWGRSRGGRASPGAWRPSSWPGIIWETRRTSSGIEWHEYYIEYKIDCKYSLLYLTFDKFLLEIDTSSKFQKCIRSLLVTLNHLRFLIINCSCLLSARSCSATTR